MSDTDTAEHPLENIAAVEAAIEPPAADHVVEAEYTEPVPATARLREFEDKTFGTECVRINGMIERGIGSPYQRAEPKVRKQYAAIEKLIAAEATRDAAHGAMLKADADYAAAEMACDAALAE